jgi:alkylhydroperoxidase/carboxymuconolactone decarboxylase family protein YurZ
MEFLKENNEQLFNNITSARNLAFRDGALSVKNRLLIALALDAAHGAVDGVKNLAKQAMDAGASKEEIFEALEVVYLISGVGSMYTAARALNEIF